MSRPRDWPAYFAARRADPDWRGCNITIPHKLAALDHVEDRGGVRGTIGAINTVAARRGRRADRHQHRCRRLLRADRRAAIWTGAPVVVIGAGGAARAILFALVAARRRAGHDPQPQCRSRPRRCSSTFGLKGEALPLDAPLPPAALLVNASALGMAGQPPLDLDLSPLPDDAVVYDIVYAPLETRAARRRRARAIWRRSMGSTC